MTWGRNDKGQLGHGDTKTRNEPTIVDSLANHEIVGGAIGRSHTLFLTSKGQVLSCGDNKMGQLGIGTQSQSVMTPTRVSIHSLSDGYNYFLTTGNVCSGYI